MMRDYKNFPEFYNNSAIQELGNIPKWTVSTNEKMPIDMFILSTFHTIRGAKFTNELSLTTLPKLCDVLPNAKNNAFYLDALTDGYVVLDVEPSCPPNLKERFLRMNYVYGEVSMSGKGYHLIFPTPSCLINYPNAQNKLAFKDENGFYEILLNHWVTFTRNHIQPSNAYSNNAFENLFETMAAEQKSNSFSIQKNEQINTLDKQQEIYNEQEIINIALMKDYGKSIDEFKGPLSNKPDLSLYEYSHMGFLNYRLNQVLDISRIKESHDYTESEKIILLYRIALQAIPYRPKHDELRNGMPWLLYMANKIRLNSTDKSV